MKTKTNYARHPGGSRGLWKIPVFTGMTILFLTVSAWAVEPVDSEPLPGGDVMITGEGPVEIIPSVQPAPSVAVSPQIVEGEATPQEQVGLICSSYQTMSVVQGPDYMPGMDAYGRPVAPADVSSNSAFDVPERIDIPVAVDVAQSMNLAPATEVGVVSGTVTVFKDGRVLYNGQNVNGPVSAYCNQLKPELNVNINQ